MIARLPCPICKGNAQAYLTGPVWLFPRVQCTCGAQGPSWPNCTPEDADAAWNAWAAGVQG